MTGKQREKFELCDLTLKWPASVLLWIDFAMRITKGPDGSPTDTNILTEKN